MGVVWPMITENLWYNIVMTTESLRLNMNGVLLLQDGL